MYQYLPGQEEDRAEVLGRAAASLRDRVRRVCERQVEFFVEDGVDYAQIVNRAEEWKADVIVVGSHGQSGVARVLGGVAEAIVRSTHCNVLVVWAPSVGADGSLPQPICRNRRFPPLRLPPPKLGDAARLEVVHAVGFMETEASYLAELGTPSISSRPNVFDVAARRLSDCVAPLLVDATCKVLDRPAASAIVDEADSIGAELIVDDRAVLPPVPAKPAVHVNCDWGPEIYRS